MTGWADAIQEECGQRPVIQKRIVSKMTRVRERYIEERWGSGEGPRYFYVIEKFDQRGQGDGQGMLPTAALAFGYTDNVEDMLSRAQAAARCGVCIVGLWDMWRYESGLDTSTIRELFNLEYPTSEFHWYDNLSLESFRFFIYVILFMEVSYWRRPAPLGS